MKNIYYKQAMNLLKHPDNFLVKKFSYWNGEIRNIYGDDLGHLSANIVDKITDHTRIKLVGSGEGILSHERYYKLTNLNLETIKTEQKKHIIDIMNSDEEIGMYKEKFTVVKLKKR